ncbi:MAG: futalosine hydrolase [Chitinophagaceae bacterium]|nr:futalosine hydrolase [Chitinophagaceae bacterium]
MKILVIAATGAEIALSIKQIATIATEEKPGIFSLGGTQIQFAVTGIGMVATTYYLTKLLAANNYDLVIQAGIGGCFDSNIPLGKVLFIDSDRMADLGAEDGDLFIDVFDFFLAKPDESPFSGKILSNPIDTAKWNIDLPAVSALTINTVTGSETSTKELIERYNCTMESMEGAAFHYVCLQEGVPFAQIRAVSNYVEKRNRATWRIGDAIKNLNAWLIARLMQHL